MQTKRTIAAAALFALALAGCTSIAPEYSLTAYTNATTLKAETLAMIDKSSEAYAGHKTEADDLGTKISAAYEYSHGYSALNGIAAEEWAIIRKNIYGSFVNTWIADSKTHAAAAAAATARGVDPADIVAGTPELYRTAEKDTAGKAFDYLICLEVNKKEHTACTPPTTPPDTSVAAPATGASQ